ncbi:hypothetical protein ACFPRL_31645 [Pseudoclavibacter helvolus]
MTPGRSPKRQARRLSRRRQACRPARNGPPANSRAGAQGRRACSGSRPRCDQAPRRRPAR